jgi:ParB-like chromosome segregation protein Spo0J
MSGGLMSQIIIPSVEMVLLSDLKVDGQNPNRMTKQQHEALKKSIQKYGFIVPIITNKDLLIADGEQRYIIAKDLSMSKVPVIRLPVEDVDRRLLRQVLNKLRGEHEILLDAQEFDRIIQFGHEQDIKDLLILNDLDIKKILAVKDAFSPVDESTQSNLGQIQKTKCPRCGYEF